jgi:hypothetical protein
MDKKFYSFNLVVNCGGMPSTNFINTDVNLLEMYKAALVSGADHLIWEKGVINLKYVVAVIDNTVV